jgi:hypothetical protein
VLLDLTFKLLIWMLLFGFYNFGHSSKTVVSNVSIFFIRKVSCSDNIWSASFPVPEQNVNTLPVYQENVENGMKTK